MFWSAGRWAHAVGNRLAGTRRRANASRACRRRRSARRGSGWLSTIEPLENRALLSTLFALTETNVLVTFDTSAPAEILTQWEITGLEPGESLRGIDVRPATGELYGLGDGRLYVIDPQTGSATLRAELTADPADATDPFAGLVGTDFGIDFNPAVDRLRVVSDGEQNLRIHPDTGRVITDTPLAYAPGDVNAGANPRVIDAAYGNNQPGAATTTLFGIDNELLSEKTLPDGSIAPALSLLTVGGANGSPSPNGGGLSTLAAFGRDGVTLRGFDIASGDGTAYVGVELDGQNGLVYALVSIDLATGADAAMGYIGDARVPITDIAVAPSVQFTAALYAVDEAAGTATITVTRTDSFGGPASVTFATSDGSATAGEDYVTTSGTLTFGPGETSQSFTIPILNDARAEGDEVLHIALGTPSGAILGRPFLAALRISANDRLDRTWPVLERVGLTGPSRAISGAVLHFNEDLDPLSAEDIGNYSLIVSGGVPRREIALSAAEYDPAARTVTLHVVEPFGQTQFKHVEIQASGKKGGVTDTSGNLLDGDANGRSGGNAKFKFEIQSGDRVRFRDTDGDRAEIVLMNGGRLDAIVPIHAPATQLTQFWIVNPVPLRSSLSGTVTRSSAGDGIVVIAEIIGLDKKEFTSFLSLSAFQVDRLTFSSNATGL
jgi:Domain of unknown function (DUF4394)/Calx-beta domain